MRGARWLSWRTSDARHVLEGLADLRSPARLLALAACAPNHAANPDQPISSPSAAESEDSRYGTLLRLAARPAPLVTRPPRSTCISRRSRWSRVGQRLYLLLGDTLIELEAFDDAAKIFEEVLKRDPDNLAAHRGYARALLGAEPARYRDRALSGGAREDANDIRRTTALASPTISPVSTRRPRPPIGPASDRARQHAAAQQSRPLAGARRAS